MTGFQCPSKCGGRPGDLFAHRRLVQKLYVQGDMPLKDVADILRYEHGVNASLNMLKKKLRQWKLRKKDGDNEITAPQAIPYQESRDSAPENKDFNLNPLDDEPNGGYRHLQQTYVLSPTHSDASGTTGPVIKTPQSIATASEEPDTPTSDDKSTEGSQEPSERGDQLAVFGSPIHAHSSASPSATRRMSPKIICSPANSNRKSNERLIIEQKYIVRSMASPDLLRTSESMFYTMRSFVADTLQPRLKPDPKMGPFDGPISKLPVTQRARLPGNLVISDFLVALNNALVTLEKLGGRAMAASLEQAFSHIKVLIASDHFSIISIITHAVISTEIYKAPLITRMLLKHIYRMSLLLKGPTHAYTVLVQNLLILVDVDLWSVLDSVIRAWGDVIEEVLGIEDIYTMRHRSVQYNQMFKLKKDKTDDVGSLLARYQPLLDGSLCSPYDHVTICSSLAGCLEDIGAFDEAEKVYLSSPALLDKVVAEGAHTVISPSPIVRAVTALGKNMAWQGKLDEARSVFAKAVDGSIKLLGPDAPTTIEAIADFGQCLAQLHLDDDAQAMYLEIDQRLAPYVLGLNTDPLGDNG